jgi:hypothetical protein
MKADPERPASFLNAFEIMECRGGRSYLPPLS